MRPARDTWWTVLFAASMGLLSADVGNNIYSHVQDVPRNRTLDNLGDVALLLMLLAWWVGRRRSKNTTAPK